MNVVNKLIFKVILLFILITSGSNQIIGQSQDSVYVFRVETSRPEVQDMMWSPDSNHFVYLEVDLDLVSEGDVRRGVFLSHPFWKSFDVNTGLLSSSSAWPLYLYIDSEQTRMLYVQSTPENPETAYPLRIANLSENSFLPTDINITSSTYPTSFTVLWSDSGDAVAVGYLEDFVYSAESKITFITIENNELEIMPFAIRLNEQEYRSYDTLTDRLYDISAEGDRVLLVGRAFIENQSLDASIPHPIIWYPKIAENSLVLNQFDASEISAASFAPRTNEQILLITYEGLVLFDLARGESQILFADFVNDMSYLQARFSPNGEWLMLEFINELRFIYIPSLLSS